MRYEDQVLLREYSLMMLRISAAKHPEATIDITPATIRKSDGFIKLRGFFAALSPIKKQRFRTFMKQQLSGVRDLMNQATKTGEAFTLADIEIDVFDSESGERVPDAPNVSIPTANDNEEQSK